MDDILLMTGVKCKSYTCDIELCALRLKCLFFEQMESKVSTGQQIDNKVHVIRVVKGIFDIYYKF